MKFGSEDSDQLALVKRMMTLQGVVNLLITLGWLALLFLLFASELDQNSKSSALLELGLVGVGWLIVLGVGQTLTNIRSKITLALGVEGAVTILMVVQMLLSGLQIVAICNGLLALALTAILVGILKESGKRP